MTEDLAGGDAEWGLGIGGDFAPLNEGDGGCVWQFGGLEPWPDLL
jgi:hypothetical protein